MIKQIISEIKVKLNKCLMLHTEKKKKPETSVSQAVGCRKYESRFKFKHRWRLIICRLNVAWRRRKLGSDGFVWTKLRKRMRLAKRHTFTQSVRPVMQSLTHSSTYQSSFIQALSFSYNIFYISLKQWSFSCCFNLCIISFAVFSHTLRKKVYVQTCSGLVTAGNMADDSRFPRLILLPSFYRGLWE